MQKRLHFFALVALVFFCLETLQAAQISKIKGNMVRLEMAPSEFAVGDKLFATQDGKKRAVIEITQVKDDRALGKIVKGTPQVGFQLILAQKATPSATEADLDAGATKTKRKQPVLMGALIGYSLDNQTVNAANSAGTQSESVAMNGSGYSVKFLLDSTLAGGVGLIGRAGLESFNVTGTSQLMVCNSSSGCNTSINYLSGDLLIRYSFTSGSFVPYLAGGLGLHYPITSSTNILNASRISATTVFFAEAGFYARLSKKVYIPLAIDYGLFPPSSDVSTNLIAIRTGLAFVM